MQRTLIAERFTCGHAVVVSIVPSSRTLWSRVRSMTTTSSTPGSHTVQCDGLCPTCRKRRITPAAAVANSSKEAPAATMENQATESGDLSTEKLSGYESFDFGFDATDVGAGQIAPMLPDISEQAEDQGLKSLANHTSLWQPPTPNAQPPVVKQRLWSSPATHYTEYLHKSRSSPNQSAMQIDMPEHIAKSKLTSNLAEYLFKSSSDPQHQAGNTDLLERTSKPKPTPNLTEYLYSHNASPFPVPEEGNTLGITIVVTPPLVPQRVCNMGLTPTLGEFSDSNFLQVPLNRSSALESPAFVEIPQRIIDPGLPESAAELEGLLSSQEESSSWSDWDRDEASSLDESEEESIDQAEARPPTPEELNVVDQFLDQQLQYAGHTYEEDQIPPSASNSTLPKASSPTLTPAQKITLEYQAIQAQREADEFLQRTKEEVNDSNPKTKKRQATSEPSPLRQVSNACEEEPTPREWNFHQNLVTEEQKREKKQAIMEFQTPGPVSVYCVADGCLEYRG
ncbi:hypothetical protein BDZ45DRAFT_747576 [Acephala macrosclerotiorum]|nr:hypothetical protein BDZ45DRAFT_747576 [Acephala macrosclerotiorum]